MKTKNHLEDPSILSPIVLNAIDYLLLKNKDFIFGGSLALNALGIVKREIKDIDVITLHNDFDKLGVKDILLPKNNKTFGEEQYDYTPGDEQLFEQPIAFNKFAQPRYPAKILETKVCFFVDPEAQWSTFEFSGRTIRIGNVNDIILAKKHYITKHNISHRSFMKHIFDIQEYQNFFDKLID